MPSLRVIVSIELHDPAKNVIWFERVWAEGPALVLSSGDESVPRMRVSFTYGSHTLNLPIQTATWDTEGSGWTLDVDYPSLGAPPHRLDAVLKAFEGDSKWSRTRPGMPARPFPA